MYPSGADLRFFRAPLHRIGPSDWRTGLLNDAADLSARAHLSEKAFYRPVQFQLQTGPGVQVSLGHNTPVSPGRKGSSRCVRDGDTRGAGCQASVKFSAQRIASNETPLSCWHPMLGTHPCFLDQPWASQATPGVLGRATRRRPTPSVGGCVSIHRPVTHSRDAARSSIENPGLTW